MVQGPFLIVSGLRSENALTDFDLWLMPTLIGERGGLVSPDHRGEGKEGRETREGLTDKTNGKESQRRTAGELGTTGRCFFQITQSPTKSGNTPQRRTGRVSSRVSHN